MVRRLRRKNWRKRACGWSPRRFAGGSWPRVTGRAGGAARRIGRGGNVVHVLASCCRWTEAITAGVARRVRWIA